MSKTFNDTGMGRIIAWISARVFKKSEAVTTQTLGIDSAPSNNSSNLVTSGGVYNALNGYINSVAYDSSTSRINFKHDSTVLAYVDAAPFIVDGMIDNVSITTPTSGTYANQECLFIDFNTASGKSDIYIPLSEIFDPDDYYTKTAADAKYVTAVTYDTTNHKFQKTVNGVTSDIVTASTVVSDGGAVTSVKVGTTAYNPSSGVVSLPAYPAAPGTLNTNNTSAQTASSSEALSGTIKLHKVAKTGTYSDLIGTPTIPSAPGTLDTTATTAQSTSSSEALSGNITLHKVSKTGSYNDLLNKPTIPEDKLVCLAYSVSSTNSFTASALTGAYTAANTAITAGKFPYLKLTDSYSSVIFYWDSKFTSDNSISFQRYDGGIFVTCVTLKSDGTIVLNDFAIQSDWEEEDSNKIGYIYNKPTIPTVNDSTITVQMNGSTVDSFTTNASSAKTIDFGTVITAHQDISGKEDKSNKVTTISTSSTDTQYPSAKCMYDRLSVPFIASKEQEGFASSSTYSVHCLLTFRPTDWNKMYTIRFKIHGWVESETDVESVSDITLQCFQGVVKSYYIENAIANTSKYAYYNLYYYGITSSGYTAGAEAIIGPYVNSANCWSYTTKRKFRVDLIWTDGCTATLLDDCNSTVAKTGFASSCYVDSVKYNTYTAGLQETGDSNTTYSVISDSELRTGTATSGRTVSAARLKANYNISTDSTTGVKTLRIADQTMTPEDITNKVTSLSSSSTDTQYPSAKCVYDIISETEEVTAAALNDLNDRLENIDIPTDNIQNYYFEEANVSNIEDPKEGDIFYKVNENWTQINPSSTTTSSITGSTRTYSFGTGFVTKLKMTNINTSDTTSITYVNSNNETINLGDSFDTEVIFPVGTKSIILSNDISNPPTATSVYRDNSTYTYMEYYRGQWIIRPEIISNLNYSLSNDQLPTAKAVYDLNLDNQRVIVGYDSDDTYTFEQTAYGNFYDDSIAEGTILQYGYPKYTSGETTEISNLDTGFWPSSTCKFLYWNPGGDSYVERINIMFYEAGTYNFTTYHPSNLDSSSSYDFSFTITDNDLNYLEDGYTQTNGEFTIRTLDDVYINESMGYLYLYYTGDTPPNVKIATYKSAYIMHNGVWQDYVVPKYGYVDRASYDGFVNGAQVWEAIHPQILNTNYIFPNQMHKFGTVTGSKTWTLVTPTYNDIVNHYFWTFETSSTAPTITWPSGLTWPGGSPPAILANKHYEISVLNNYVAWMEI